MDSPADVKILILEDDEGVAQLERRRLERAGYSAVTVVRSVDEARHRLVFGCVDLLLVDYNLGGAINGLELHRSLRESGVTVPAILVTGRSDEAILADAIRSGIRDFIAKNEGFLDFLVPTVERVLMQVAVERQLESEQAARAEAEAEKRAMAEEDRRKDEFLAMLAHELRNPLSAISTAVELARVSGAREEQTWANEVISRQVGHLSHLIDDLLDVSRIRLGKIQLRKRVIDLADVIPRAIETVRPLIDRKRHDLSVRIDQGPHHVEADPTRVEQILVNLLTNAAKYTDEGGEVTLSIAREDDHIAVRVADTGVGIDPAMLGRIFDLFIQVDGSLDRAQGGLGIGLTLVQTLVTMHGGTISAMSEGIGRGSTFTVQLPTSNASAERSQPIASPAVRRSRRILVVDDNTDSAQGMARLVRSAGHEVALAHDGPEALQAAHEFRPDVVLLDIGLPGMDGRQVAAQLRSEGFGDATILAISGYGREEDRKQSFDSGFDDHLVKPIDYDALLSRIAE